MKRSIWNWLFLISSFGLGILLGFAVWQETFPEWRGYQAAYYRRLAQVTGDPSKAGTPLKIRQIYLPEFHRVDRCITCHVGIDNPKMKGQPQPFAAHPDLGIPGFLEKHSFTEMGCTVCHNGQGPATTKEHAHGHVKHWEEPMLDKELTIATCATCHQNVMNLQGTERLAQAKALFDEKGCIGCHSLHGVGNQIGPELAETAYKSEDQFDFRGVRGEHTVVNWIEEHFKDPQQVTPGDPAIGIPETPMPNYELSDDETKMLTALILSFAYSEEKEGQPIPSRFKVAGAAPEKTEPVYTSSAERGKAVFQKYGCMACHGIGGRGGVRNVNMEPGEEVPPLIYVADGFTKEELKDVIRHGRYPPKADSKGPTPPLWMPAWKDKISEEELDPLVDYLLSLHPESRQKAAPQSAKEG